MRDTQDQGSCTKVKREEAKQSPHLTAKYIEYNTVSVADIFRQAEW